jgi:hypothetical protein
LDEDFPEDQKRIIKALTWKQLEKQAERRFFFLQTENDSVVYFLRKEPFTNGLQVSVLPDHPKRSDGRVGR